VQDGGETTIKFQTLDISDQKSIHSFRDFLKEEHSEGIDILVNNAGIAMDGFGQLISLFVPRYVY
jgi:carbonyl reductase 1